MGIWVLDTYTQQTQVNLKNLTPKDLEISWKELKKKYG